MYEVSCYNQYLMMTTNRSAARKGHDQRLARALLWGAILGIITAGGWYMTFMPGKSWSDPVPPLTVDEQLIHDNVKRHVEMLAQQIGERNIWNA